MISAIFFILVFFLLSFLIYRAYQAATWKKCLYLILLLGFGIRGYLATDLYLHKWDERLHALVAKNLIGHPLKPTLYDNPILPYNYKNWVESHIWLGKPALPLWFIASSIKIFGINEFALRLPSLLCALLSIVLTYRIGKELFGEKIGLIASYLHTIHGLSAELSAGIISSDHTERLFLLGVQAALLFAVIYSKKPFLKYAFFIGLCMGVAFLSKWISSFIILFIFFGFHIHLKSPLIKIVNSFAIILLGFLLVASPWVIYLFLNFPTESTWMAGELFSLLNKAVQGHSGSILYYVDEIRILFGELIYLPVLWLGYKYLSRKRKSKLGFLFYWIFIPLILLSIADMKRHTYILVSAPPFFILTSFFFRYLQMIKDRIRVPSIIIKCVLVLLIALPIRYSLERIKPFKARFVRPDWYHTMNNFSKTMSSDPSKTILVGEPNFIEAMFYFEFIAYEYLPLNSQIESLKAKGYRIFEKTQNDYVEK